MIPTHTPEEVITLENCLKACKRELDRARAEGNEILEATTEADMNDILQRLQGIYEKG